MSDDCRARDLHAAIMMRLTGRQKGSVVSTNVIIDEVRVAVPGEHVDAELVRAVGEAALRLGLVPVFDPSRIRGARPVGSYCRTIAWPTGRTEF